MSLTSLDPQVLEPTLSWVAPAGFAATTPRDEGADWHCVIQDQGAARASLWWKQTPHLVGHQLALIGHFAATDAASAQQIIREAADQARQQGASHLIGPMNGSTWRDYRFVLPGAQQVAPFLFEPQQPAAWPEWFVAAGFEPCAYYASALVDDLQQRDPRALRATERLQASGVIWRSLNRAQPEAELRAIHQLSLQAFKDNLLYTPLDEQAFLDRYLPLLGQLDPDLVLMAEKEQSLVGYLFALPDYAQQARGEPVQRVIIKTVAVLPGRQQAGLGAVLVDECQRRAAEKGYVQAIHALMHEGNVSLRLSGQQAKPFRRYGLWMLDL